MLILTMNPGQEYIQIGDDIRIYLRDSAYSYGTKQVRLAIDAPKHIRIIRSNALDKKPKDQQSTDQIQPLLSTDEV